MTKQVQLRKGTTAEHSVFTGAVAELTIDTTLDIAIVHDGIKVGGHPLVGAKTLQEITNKTGIGIGTTSITKELEVIGDAEISGEVMIGTLQVNDSAGISTVITSSGSDRYLENIIIDCGSFW